MNTLKKLALLALSLPLAVFGYAGGGTWPYTENGVTFSCTVSGDAGDEACVSITSCGDSAEVEIPSEIADAGSVYKVTSIGQTSSDCRAKLASVVIPSSVTSIGVGAFWNCSGLTSVTIPSSVKSIGGSAFNGCTGLESVTIPDSVTSIGDWAFYGCSGLTSVTIPSSVTIIGDRLFRSCSGLTSVTISNGVTSIAELMFANCSKLTSVTIPNSVTSIGSAAFAYCTGLKTVIVDQGDVTRVKELFQDSNVGVDVNTLTFVEEVGLTALAVTPIAPFGVAVDYAYTTMVGATATYTPVIIATDGSKVYTATTLTEPQSLSESENTYRVYWNMAKDGVPSLAGATISVTLKEKLPAESTATPKSSNTLKFDNVTTSVLTNGSKVSEEVKIDCKPFEGATVTVTVNGTAVTPTEDGSYAWLPSKVGTNEVVYTITDANNFTATFTVSYDAVERAPVITDVAVTKVAPLGVAVDYTYTMMENATTAYTPVITATTVDGAGETVYTATTLSAPQSQSTSENKYRVYWNMAKDGVPSLAGATISVTLKEKLSELTEYCVIDLPDLPAEEAAVAALSYDITWTDDVPDGGNNKEDEYKTAKLVLKRINAGEFIMGEDQTSSDALANHKVTLTQPFYMALFETTQSQWQRVTGSNPSMFTEDSSKRPIEQVSYDMIRGSTEGTKWPDSKAVDDGSFLGLLRARTGLSFDLPTEAQWEYAYHAGTTTKWSFGKDDSIADDYMWSSENSGWVTPLPSHRKRGVTRNG